MRPAHVLPVASFLALFVLACGARSPEEHRRVAHSRREPRPRLVVAVVVDQFGSWVLQRYAEYLPANGALKHGLAIGSYHDVMFPYAGTYTAPGHATLFTGTPPSESGIVANRTWVAARRAHADSVDDERYPVIGNPEASASPLALRTEGVADVLDRTTNGAAKIVGLSLKDRGAVLPAGKHPDLVLWYESAISAYTTSTYYAEALPGWLDAWQRANPMSTLIAPWTPENPTLYARVLGPDDAPGEGNWQGLGNVFPHDIARTESPYGTLRATPMSTDYLLDLAMASVEALDMGLDDVPDLLTISISSIDYIGHVFGNESWEYLDALLRMDRALAEFLRRLEARTTIAVLVSSDHGSAPLVERVAAEGGSAGRIINHEMRATLDAAVDEALGPGDWIDAYAQPFITLSAKAHEPANFERALRIVIDRLHALPSIGCAYDVREARALQRSSNAMDRLAGFSIPDDAPGDIFVAPARNFVVDEELGGGGTSHGTPWEYDRRIPVIFWGAGVRHTRGNEDGSALQVAPTLSALLGIDAPAQARALPLTGVD